MPYYLDITIELSIFKEPTSGMFMKLKIFAFGQTYRWLHLKEGVWQKAGDA